MLFAYKWVDIARKHNMFLSIPRFQTQQWYFESSDIKYILKLYFDNMQKNVAIILEKFIFPFMEKYRFIVALGNISFTINHCVWLEFQVIIFFVDKIISSYFLCYF